MLLAMLCNFIFLTYSLILWGGGEAQEKQWLLCAQWWVAPELRAGRGSVGERGLGAPGCSPGHRKVWRFLSIRVVEHFFFFNVSKQHFSTALFSEMFEPFLLKLPSKFQPEAEAQYGKHQSEMTCVAQRHRQVIIVSFKVLGNR